MRIVTSYAPYKTNSRNADRHNRKKLEVKRVFILTMRLLSSLIVSCAAFLCAVQGSAIPMWEFLTKDEKMSYLYSMFANQVDEFCKKSAMANCEKELLKYGLGMLKDMPEDHLDVMDPYQRGANDIIWDSMMEGHEMVKVKTTAKPRQEEAEAFGNEASASARIDNVYTVPPPKDFVYNVQSGTPEYVYPKRLYSKFRQTHPNETPSAVRVYPDGKPVASELPPDDDDLQHYQLTQLKIPNF